MRIASVQNDPRLGDVDGNLERMQATYRTAREHGADLVLFTECALSGYGFESKAEARRSAQSVPGPAVDHWRSVCRDVGGTVAFGLLEADGDALYNTVALVGPSGLVGRYRKTHLPWLGADRFTQSGDEPFALFDMGDLRVGVLICYDGGFPEPTRCLALLGADLVILPTNWPPGAERAAEVIAQMRSIENTIYFATCSRVGTERGVTFVGRSRICDPLGRTLAEANGMDDVILYADVDPSLARKKHLIRAPGTNEVNRIADRRPELYGVLVQPHSLPRPGGR